ncbi:MAG TPA: hypothetical protein VHF07_08250 [Nitrospiraceae bacterium]|nr:hypothetical protein [Nitrospiraceae bacterium]
MVRPLRDVTVPWQGWRRPEAEVRQHWRLIAVLIVAALLLIGVRAAGGLSLLG